MNNFNNRNDVPDTIKYSPTVNPIAALGNTFINLAEVSAIKCDEAENTQQTSIEIHFKGCLKPTFEIVMDNNDSDCVDEFFRLFQQWQKVSALWLGK